MNGRHRTVAAGAFGALAFALALAGADAARAQAEQERSEALARYGGEVTTLVVSRRELSQGEELTQADLEQREWLADLAPAGAVSSMDEVVGKRLASPVAEGQPLCAVDFASADEGVDVPAGRVAVAVGDRTGLAGSAASGARVVAYEVDDEDVALVTADALVLAASATRSGQTASPSQEAFLAVSPGDVSRVLEASAKGSLRLVLPADDVGEGGQGAGAEGVGGAGRGVAQTAAVTQPTGEGEGA